MVESEKLERAVFWEFVGNEQGGGWEQSSEWLRMP